MSEGSNRLAVFSCAPDRPASGHRERASCVIAPERRTPSDAYDRAESSKKLFGSSRCEKSPSRNYSSIGDECNTRRSRELRRRSSNKSSRWYGSAQRFRVAKASDGLVESATQDELKVAAVAEDRWGRPISGGSMNDLTLAANWNDAPTANETAPKRLLKFLPRPKKFTAASWQTLEQVTFGLFIGSLVALLVLLYSDILII
jgi:hypothetical protein